MTPPADLALPTGAWPEPIAEVIVVPVTTAGDVEPCAFLVAGVNPRRRIDAGYRSFFELAAGHVATAITTARAYEEERRRAQALAELDRAKTQFFSNVSHEFRTPLTLLLGPLEDALADGADLPAERREQLALAHRNALRLQRLVNALLDFSRLEAGRAQAHVQPTDLAALSADLASAFRAATDKAGLRLVVDAPPLSAPVHVDRGMWETILLNLLSNAFKFTMKGEIRVSVREEGGQARVTVSDTGVGIPRAELPRLFDRFHRVAGAEGRSFEGSGIGLALVQELVRQHGGEITVHSELGRGSAFTIAVPFGAAHLPADRVADQGSGPADRARAQAFVDEALRWLPDEARGLGVDGADQPPPDPRARSRRILVADDNADLRAYIARLLAAQGYVVSAVGDGEAALKRALAEKPDLLVTDVMMPKLDGFGLLRAVRADERLRDLPVIMLSARAGGEATVEGLDSGADDYLVKPFSARELLARVGATIALAGMRRETAAALVESEARFRNMADHAPVMMWVSEADAFCTYLNRAWYAFTGQTPQEAEGLGWLDAVHPDDRAWSFDLFRAASARREAVRLEYRLRRADGRRRWVLAAASPRFAPDGAFAGYIGSVIDIDERREAEQRLRELNETLEQRVAEALAERKLLADLVEGTDAFVQVVDLDFRWLAVNKAAADEFERIFGVRPKVGDSMLDLLEGLPEHREAVRAVWSRALAGEEFTEVGVFGDPARRRRFYEMKYNILRDAAGRRIGAYQFVYDVSQRIQEQQRLAEAEAEAARRETDALYRAFFQNTPEALFVIAVTPDGDFVVEEVNPAHEAGVGFKLETIRGKRIENVLPPDLAARVVETYRHVVETGTIHQYRDVFDLHGEIQHWDASLVPMRDETGRIVRIIGSSRNVTRQVVAEEALRQSQKMEAMGQLTGGVAHDFNNLLTPIAGALDMLQRTHFGGERERRLIAAAAQSADRAKTLVQRLLAFARRQPLQTAPVDLGRLVDSMADLIASTTGPQIKVLVDIARDLPPAMADPNQLEMAVLNLAVNARDAMPTGGTLRITVEAATVGRQHRSGLPPGRYLRLSVADTGVGMDEATLARAFEPFFSTKGVGKGTGLGLSMVHGLALQLDGAVTIHSKPGLGTNVELWLPQGDAAPSPRETAPGAAASPPSAKPVLLIDDEDLVRLSTADMLIELGYQVVEAASAEEALRLLAQGLNPELAITDHLMPGISGADLARVLQTDRPFMKVLIVSGYAEMGGIAPDLPRLTKPFRVDELAASLLELR